MIELSSNRTVDWQKVFDAAELHPYVCLNVRVLLLHFRFAALQPLQRARHQYDVETNVRQLVTELKSDACCCARHNSPSGGTVGLAEVSISLGSSKSARDSAHSPASVTCLQ